MHYLAPRHQRLKVALPSPRLALPTSHQSAGTEHSMHAAIVATEAFTYTAEIRPLAVPAGTYHLAIRSQWTGAKDPEATHTAFQASTDRAGLLALRTLIDQVLAGAV